MTRLLLLLLALLAAPAHALTEKDLLEYDQAFRLSVRAVDADTLEVRYAIAPGYYIYREKFAFEAPSRDATLGKPVFPAGTPKQDEFFGRVETYRKEVKILLPVEGAAAGDTLTLKVSSQGCWDKGVCYPPTPQQASALFSQRYCQSACRADRASAH
jgi:thiol:disulfide interchange protein DsbD